MSTQVVTPNETQTATVVTYVNDKPTVPAETPDTKYEVREVSRTLKTVNGEEKKVMYVLVPVAKTLEGLMVIAENSIEKAIGYFNDGLFSSLRVKASNELSGGSAEDKAFAKIVKAVSGLPMFSGKSEEEIATTLRGNPALVALFSK